MAPSKLSNAIGLVKDHASIGLAKVNKMSTTLSDLEVSIVKATRHEEYPSEEKYIKLILSLTCYSRAHVGACVSTISRRLSNTKNWVVALKTLILIHRLLREGNPSYKKEFYSTMTRRGTRLLNMSGFKDTSRSSSWDYSGFVRTYALYLDYMLQNRMQGKRGNRKSNSSNREESDEEETNSGAIILKTTPTGEMKIEKIISTINHLVQIIGRFLACRPTGKARTHRLVLVALYPIIRESFYVYYQIAEMLGLLIGGFMDLGITECIRVHELFCLCCKKFDEMNLFYSWSQSMGIAHTSEYPEVEHISRKKLKVMGEFIRETIAAKTMIKTIEAGPKQELETLPPPEQEESPEQIQPKAIVEVKEENKTPEMGDLLNLGEDSSAINHPENQLALALFEDAPPNVTTGGLPPWEAFEDSGDWETALVKSTSHLGNQNASLPGGFNALVLDGMYKNGGMNNQTTASSGLIATGSASSVAAGNWSAGRPGMLALPAPSTRTGEYNAIGSDPFAASLSIPPPGYVQMYEMEKKQRLLVEEQLIWQQYASDGRQGHMPFAQMQ